MPPLLVQPVAPVRKGRRPIGVLAMIVVAALVVVGGGAYAITRVLFPSGGYANPDDLAASIETAVETNSLMSLANALPPSEVSILTAAQQVDEGDGQFFRAQGAGPTLGIDPAPCVSGNPFQPRPESRCHLREAAALIFSS